METTWEWRLMLARLGCLRLACFSLLFLPLLVAGCLSCLAGCCKPLCEFYLQYSTYCTVQATCLTCLSTDGYVCICMSRLFRQVGFAFRYANAGDAQGD